MSDVFWCKNEAKRMPKHLQERKRGHADFVAQGGSAGMFRGSENMEK